MYSYGGFMILKYILTNHVVGLLQLRGEWACIATHTFIHYFTLHNTNNTHTHTEWRKTVAKTEEITCAVCNMFFTNI